MPSAEISVYDVLDYPKNFLNQLAADKEPWKVIVGTCIGTAVAIKVYHEYAHGEPWEDTKKAVFRIVRKVPAVKRRIEQELDKTGKNLEEEMVKDFKGKPYIQELPKEGWSDEKILEEVKLYSSWGGVDWKNGRTSGAIYHARENLYQLQMKSYNIAVSSNLLHADLFPGARKMEAEVVRMVASMFHGNKSSCGTMTGGGTESLVMACHAYRNYAREVKGIQYPEMVIPVTAHAGFDKAAEFFSIRVRHVPLDPVTMAVDVKAMKRAINKNTIMLVGSSPGFPHGVVDPIEEIGKLGVRYDIPVHVDACLGGFLVPFMEKAGYPLPPFDFRVPGVTSISCDTHKYGFCIKGTSVILYSDEKYRHHQYFVQPNWPGGIYASPTIAGSRPGGVVVATWASLMSNGFNGYVESTRNIIKVAKYIEQEIRKTKGLRIVGKPSVSVVAFDSKVMNVYRLSDALTKKGWNLNTLQFPPSIHIAVTDIHTQPGVAEKFISDVRAAAEEVKNCPKADEEGKAAMYGMAATIPDRSIVNLLAWKYLDSVYNTNVKVPSCNGH